MSPQEQIAALMAGVADQPPDAILPCKANKTHTIDLRLSWADDQSPVPTANFEVYRGAALFTSDMVAKGKFKQKKLPPGNYKIFFPGIHDAEIIEE